MHSTIVYFLDPALLQLFSREAILKNLDDTQDTLRISSSDNSYCLDKLQAWKSRYVG